MENIINTNTLAGAPAPGLGRRMATKLLVSAGTVGVVLLTSDTLVLAGRTAERAHKRELP